MSSMHSTLTTRERLQSHGHNQADLEAQYRARFTPYALEDHELLQRQRRRESNARSYPRRIPLALRRGQGIYVQDVEGRVFIDCLACAGALPLGHNHPIIKEAIQQAFQEDLPFQTLDLTTPTKDRFIADLFALLPESFARRARVQFCGPTGTDGVEAALKLVKTATGRSNMLAFHGAYHGMSQGSLALMGNLGPKRHTGPFGPVQFLPYPYDYRCPFGLRGQAGEQAGLAYIRNMLEDPESGIVEPAGMILEAVQGEGGVIPASSTWLRGVRELTRKAGIPLIIDEVQTGFARTGKLFAFEHAGITPDVVVFSKAIGGGLPLSVVVYDEALDVWKAGSHAGTFRGNQLAMATGSAVMKFIQHQRLDQHAADMGERLTARLNELKQRHNFVGDVRGRGLMLGVEIVHPSDPPDDLGHRPSSAGLCGAIQQACLRRGLILETGGRNSSVLRLLPPLIITAAQIDEVAQIIADSMAEVEREGV